MVVCYEIGGFCRIFGGFGCMLLLIRRVVSYFAMKSMGSALICYEIGGFCRGFQDQNEIQGVIVHIAEDWAIPQGAPGVPGRPWGSLKPGGPRGPLVAPGSAPSGPGADFFVETLGGGLASHQKIRPVCHIAICWAYMDKYRAPSRTSL